MLKASLPRILLSAGLLASPSAALEFDISPITSTLTTLPARASLAACSALLLSSTEPSFRLLAATNGGAESTRGLFDRALGEEESLKWEVFSCDEIKVAKPAQEMYEAVWKKLGMEKKKTRAGWFIASHSWYMSGIARLYLTLALTLYCLQGPPRREKSWVSRLGASFLPPKLTPRFSSSFQTAWVSYEEHVPLDTLFGAPDIVASDLEDAASQILVKEAEKAKMTFM